MSSVLELIKDSLKKKKLFIGYRTTTKALKNGKVEKIIISNNAPQNIVEQITHLCSIGNIEMMTFKGSNTELGAACRKPFGIMILGVKK